MSTKSIIGENRSERLRNIAFALIVGNLCYTMIPISVIAWRFALISIALFCILRDRQTFYEKNVLLFLGMIMLYFLIAFFYSNPTTTSIGDTFSAFASFYTFSYFNRKHVITEKFISVASICLIVGCYVYYSSYEDMLIQLLSQGEDDVTVNASSVFMFLIPFLFYVKNRWLAFAELCICVFFIVSSVKRGNIIAAAIPVFLFLKYRLIEFKTNKMKTIILLCLVICAGFYLGNMLQNNDYFMFRYEKTLDGDSSDRDLIYAQAYHVFLKSSSFNMIFGNGYDATFNIIHVPAHCDWLELLVDYGIIGVLIYLSLFVNFFRKCMYTVRSIDKYVIGACLSMWSFKSIYSMAYLETWMMIMMIAFGIALTNTERYK